MTVDGAVSEGVREVGAEEALRAQESFVVSVLQPVRTVRAERFLFPTLRLGTWAMAKSTHEAAAFRLQRYHQLPHVHAFMLLLLWLRGRCWSNSRAAATRLSRPA